MDDSVLAAMAKWPNVPEVFGWLSLDARGQWRLRGEPLNHPAMLAFIQRNYTCDRQGRAYFQNGPQQVFVELEATPWIWRVQQQAGSVQIHSHTGAALAVADVQQVLLDEQGALYLLAPQGLGMVHTQDMLDAAAALEAGWLPEPQSVEREALPGRYGYVINPLPAAKA